MIEQRVRVARNQALSLVNTPNFREMAQMWWINRKAMYSKYYDMFKSYDIHKGYNRVPGSNTIR
jgi:hypothetical protein